MFLAMVFVTVPFSKTKNLVKHSVSNAFSNHYICTSMLFVTSVFSQKKMFMWHLWKDINQNLFRHHRKISWIRPFYPRQKKHVQNVRKNFLHYLSTYILSSYLWYMILTCPLPICMQKFYLFSKYKHLKGQRHEIFCFWFSIFASYWLLPALNPVFYFCLFVLICCLHSACIYRHLMPAPYMYLFATYCLLPALLLYLLLQDANSLSHCLLPASVCLLLHVLYILLPASLPSVPCARIHRPSFCENKPKTLVFNDWKRMFLARFRENWVYKFGDWRLYNFPMQPTFCMVFAYSSCMNILLYPALIST